MIKVIYGPMFSGKSEYLIKEYSFMKKNQTGKIQAFKPSKDTRDKTEIRSRSLKETIPAIVVKSFEDVIKNIEEDTTDVFIDEVQFLTGDVTEIKKLSVFEGINFYISGLALTSELKPFGSMPNILAIADEIINLFADCKCGRLAKYTYCKIKKSEDVLVGDKMEYKPMCLSCYRKEVWKDGERI